MQITIRHGLYPWKHRAFFSNFLTNFVHNGISKAFAHRLFSSLGNPYDNNDEENIYLGAKRLDNSEVTNAYELINDCQLQHSNIIIFCCELNRDNNAGVYMHFVVVWLLEASNSILYYDPMFGVDSPTENSEWVKDYLVPKSLMEEREDKKAVVYMGKRRCAYYFNAPLDSNGVLMPRAQHKICDYLNARVKYLVTNVFSVTEKNVPKVFTLRSQSFDEDAIFQTKKLSVRRSLLRSVHTGNCIGNSLFVKKGQEIKLAEDVGHWEGTLLALTVEERKELVEIDPSRQFYAVGLQLGAAVLESIRMEAGLPINAYDRYVGELDCYDTAKSGVCLMSYANTLRDVYHEYGFRVQANATRPNQSGCTRPVLRALSDIKEDSEILWAYGQHLRMPKTIEEEEFSKIGGGSSYNSWSFSFTRQEVIEYLTLFRSKFPINYNNALRTVNDAIKNDESNMEITKHSTGKISFLSITSKDIGRCRTIADVGDKRKKSEYDVSTLCKMSFVFKCIPYTIMRHNC